MLLRTSLCLLGFSLAIAGLGGVASAAEKQFPAAMMKNVKTDFQAKGDGVTDDTAAINLAIASGGVIYFPAGVYLVTDRIEWKDSGGGWKNYRSIQGEGKTSTVIKLKDKLPAYSDPMKPRAVIYTASQPTGDNSFDPVTGAGNAAFTNSIFDIGVDTGKGNPGAVGIDYLANNFGAIRDVQVRSGDGKGVAGISMKRAYPGPSFLTGVSVEGFDYGIDIAKSVDSLTLEHIALSGQLQVGLRNSSNIIQVRDLKSMNTVPAVLNEKPTGALSILDSKLDGGSAEVSAIDNTVGILFARNVTSTGYASALKVKDGPVPGEAIEEYVSSDIESLFPSPQKALGLPIEETPTFHDDDMEQWADVRDYGATAGGTDDDTAGIQAAIDSGKSTVFLSGGDYHVSDTIHVRGSVRRIVGAYTFIRLAAKHTFTDAANPKPLWLFKDLEGETVTLERFRMYDTSGPLPGLKVVVIATPKTVVLRDMATDMQGASSITGEPGSGKLFLEDVVGCLNFDHPQKVWARQWNFENFVHEATNAGGRWWIMGYKTEGIKTLKTSAGGWTELLGGMLYSNKMVPADVPAFINEESHVSLTYTENSDVADRFITEHVRETRDGETKTQVRDDLPSRGYGRYAGLYVGYKESPPVEGTGGGGGGGGGESVGAGGSEGVGGGSGTGGTQEVSGDEGGCGCELPGRESRSSVPISALVTALAAALVRWKRQRAR